MKMADGYHNPVLLYESVQALITDRNGVYVDATFGGGGHSREVLSKLGTNGKLIGVDQDEDAAANIPDDGRFEFVQANFRYLRNNLKFIGHPQVSGILADLGVSSHQFDVAERGFSIRKEGKLDMRMGQNNHLSAQNLINEYGREELIRVFKTYGELREAPKLAGKILQARDSHPIETTTQLIELVKPLARPQKENQFLAQVFQAIRIEVNGEMQALADFLKQTKDLLAPGGKLVVIAYHSLEDRLVKRFMKTGNLEGKPEKDFYGNLLRPFIPDKGMPIMPGKEEIENNNRARSAKLRIATRNEED